MVQQVNSYNGRVQSNDPPRGYPWITLPDTDSEEFAVRTIEAIMLDVGDDPILAQIAKDEELSRERDGVKIKPRVTLISRLDAVIEAAS